MLTWLLPIPKCPRVRCHVLRGGGCVIASKFSLLAGEVGESSNRCDPKRDTLVPVKGTCVIADQRCEDTEYSGQDQNRAVYHSGMWEQLRGDKAGLGNSKDREQRP